MSIRQASKAFNVPRSTLQDKVNERVPLKATSGPDPVLTRVVRRQRSSPRGNQITIATFSECHSKLKVKVIRSKIMVWCERSCQKKYTSEI